MNILFWICHTRIETQVYLYFKYFWFILFFNICNLILQLILVIVLFLGQVFMLGFNFINNRRNRWHFAIILIFLKFCCNIILNCCLSYRNFERILRWIIPSRQFFILVNFYFAFLFFFWFFNFREFILLIQWVSLKLFLF